MKIRTRSALIGTIASAASLAVLSVPTTAQAEPDLGLGTPQANTVTMADEIRELMKGNAFGYQFAIAQDGLLEQQDARGTAISKADNFGIKVGMETDMKMELANVTENFTAVATLKLLRAKGLSVNAYVYPYLPDAWVDTKFKSVRFSHLLSHTAGIAQALTSMPESLKPTHNGWSAMKTIVQYGVQADSARKYSKADYAMLRVLNAELWAQVGPYEGVTITKGNHTAFALDYLRKGIFIPSDLNGVECSYNKGAKPVRSYKANANQFSKGKVQTTRESECAGHAGIALSSVQLLQYLAHLEHGSIIHDDDLATMKELRAGWNLKSGGYDGNGDGAADDKLSVGNYFQAGDLATTKKQLHHCAVTFNDGTEATLLVNSKLDKGAPSPCRVLLKAWHEAI